MTSLQAVPSRRLDSLRSGLLASLVTAEQGQRIERALAGLG